MLKKFSELVPTQVEWIIQQEADVMIPTSLKLHEKLGFLRIKENPKAIRYSITVKDLETNLTRLFRGDRSISK